MIFILEQRTVLVKYNLFGYPFEEGKTRIHGFDKKTGGDWAKGKSNIFLPVSGKQHAHKIHSLAASIVYSHDILSKINLGLLTIRKLFNLLILPGASSKLRNVISFSDIPNKVEDCFRGYLENIGIVLFQPIIDLSSRTIRTAFNLSLINSSYGLSFFYRC